MTIVTTRTNTAQAELSELLNRNVTISMICERTKLTREQLFAVASGNEESLEIFEKLFSLNMLMDVADDNEKTPDEMLEQLIHEKHMAHIFFNDCPSANEITCYADKHGV